MSIKSFKALLGLAIVAILALAGIGYMVTEHELYKPLTQKEMVAVFNLEGGEEYSVIAVNKRDDGDITIQTTLSGDAVYELTVDADRVKFVNGGDTSAVSASLHTQDFDRYKESNNFFVPEEFVPNYRVMRSWTCRGSSLVTRSESTCRPTDSDEAFRFQNRRLPNLLVGLIFFEDPESYVILTVPTATYEELT
ncbi:hypothetical protein GX865_01310 [Candidatus Saccharibacteria bacterium]|jgi:hypothetical protein|nr:hypothetical protein [Candidatus Saccharibacteria bacterium]